MDYQQPVNSSDRSWVIHILGVILVVVFVFAVMPAIAGPAPTSACDRSAGPECALERALAATGADPSDVELYYLRLAQDEYIKDVLAKFDKNDYVIPVAPAPLDDLVLWLQAVDGAFRFDKETMNVLDQGAAIQVYLGETLVAQYQEGWMRVYTRYAGVHDASLLLDCRATIVAQFNIDHGFACPLVSVEIRRLINGVSMARQMNQLGLVLTDWEEVVLADLVNTTP